MDKEQQVRFELLKKRESAEAREQARSSIEKLRSQIDEINNEELVALTQEVVELRDRIDQLETRQEEFNKQFEETGEESTEASDLSSLLIDLRERQDDLWFTRERLMESVPKLEDELRELEKLTVDLTEEEKRELAAFESEIAAGEIEQEIKGIIKEREIDLKAMRSPDQVVARYRDETQRMKTDIESPVRTEDPQFFLFRSGSRLDLGYTHDRYSDNGKQLDLASRRIEELLAQISKGEHAKSASLIEADKEKVLKKLLDLANRVSAAKKRIGKLITEFTEWQEDPRKSQLFDNANRERRELVRSFTPDELRAIRDRQDREADRRQFEQY